MGMDEISKIKMNNQLLINAKPVFKDEPDEKIFMKFNFVGAVWVKPVYINSSQRMIRRVGDCIYVAFPYGTDKDEIKKCLNGINLSGRVRRYIRTNFSLSNFPTTNRTGSPKDGFVIINGKKYSLKLQKALNKVIALEDNTYFITYRKEPKKAFDTFKTWHRSLSEEAFANALTRACEINGFPKSDIKFMITNGSAFIYKNKKQAHLCVPEGAVALCEKDLTLVALYYVLCHDYKFTLEQMRTYYPHLQEVAFYVTKRLGLRIERDAMTQQMDRVYSDNYIARHGEKAYNIIDQILVGKSRKADKVLHLCSNLYLP